MTELFSNIDPVGVGDIVSVLMFALGRLSASPVGMALIRAVRILKPWRWFR